MTNYRIDSEEEALFRSYADALYYVQSPSTISHANSGEIIRNNNETAYLSPLRSSETFINNTTNASHEVNPLALSRYSSSRGSTNSFLHEKKVVPYDVQSCGTRIITLEDINRGNRRMSDIAAAIEHNHYEGEDEDEDDEDYFDEKEGEWWRYLAFSNSTSCGWKFLQTTWRFLLSVVIALIVFYIITKPPAPKMSIKVARISQFDLREGVDGSGVGTKILTCKLTLDLVIDNKSKLFGLGIHPPVIEMFFGSLLFATSQGPELHAGSNGLTNLELYVGAKSKPMYGAGRSMQDMLESKKGLPLLINVRVRSSFHVVWGLIKPKFHHQARCLLVLGNAYDKKRRTQAYISSCRINSS